MTHFCEGDHLGLDHIYTKEELCNVKGTLLKAIVDGVGVFNADDDELMRLARNFHGNKILFSLNENNPYIQEQINRQEAVIFYDKKHSEIILKSKNILHKIPVSNIKITHKDSIEFQIMNLMAATAGVWGMDVNLENIVSILESMNSSNQLALGRFNVFSINERNLIIDYGHNFDAIKALISTLEHFSQKRRILMITSPDDRRDQDIIAQANELSHHFDEVVIYQENLLRCRQDGEIIEVIKKGFNLDARVKHIHVVKNEKEALDFTLNLLQKDDLGLLLLDSYEMGIKKIHQHYADEKILS